MMSDRAVFDIIKILADAMPWDELISFTFEVTLIDISLSVIEFAVSNNDAFCMSFIEFYLFSSVIIIGIHYRYGILRFGQYSIPTHCNMNNLFNISFCNFIAKNCIFNIETT